jgi:electron transfer flavoprotein beta subunit
MWGAVALPFNCIVLVKQVPDTANVTAEAMKADGTVNRGALPAIFNPEDLNALETALEARDRFGGTVTALTMGPPKAADVLRACLVRGADRAILLTDRRAAASDTLATSYILAQAVKTIGDYDLVFAGRQAIDGDTAQVGPGLAWRLDIPFVSYIRKISAVEDDQLQLERLMDDGYDELEVDLPALLTVVREINEPRIPSLKGKMKAKKIQVTVYSAADIDADPACIGLAGSPTQVVKVFSPEVRGDKTILSGTVDEQVEQLAERLTPYL